MNTTIKLCLTLTVTLVLTSCDTPETSDETIKNEALLKKETANRSLEEVDWDNPEEFENQMQWISYMAAQVLLRSEEARQLFQNEIYNSSGSNTIPLENLIGSDIADLSFKNEFRDEFLTNYHENNPCDGIGKPRNRPKPPGTIGGTAPGVDPNDYLVHHYYSVILDGNCLELYMPNGFAFLQATGTFNNVNIPIKTTAHPLTFDNFNSGFIHNNACSVQEIDVIDNSSSGLIIATRPYRNNSNCLYDKYSMNFEDFLN